MIKPPLLVRVAFHPQSEEARRLAVDLHHALNDDPAVPGLRIPTAFVPEDGTGAPPDAVTLGTDAEREFVIVLADAPMAVAVAQARSAGSGRTWGDCLCDLYEACIRDPHHRFMPVQLSLEGWPIDPRLGELNFLRASGHAKETERHAFVRRHMVHEICRHLGSKAAGTGRSPAPVTVFLSHTKLDIKKKPLAVRELIAHLKADQPVNAWVDSGDIEAGSPFAQRIAEGVEDAAMMVVRTDAYASREWCRREILLAKRHQRPVIVVDALCQREVRSFPYSGNVPVLRWTGKAAAAAAIDLLLKENLRCLHAQATLAARCCPGDAVLTNAPELVTLAQFAPGTTVLYPDPPLGQEELTILEHTKVQVETPLQRFARSVERLALPKPVALSHSESGDVEAYGLAPIHQDAAAVEISRYLLLAGATLAYAGHLAKGGYTQVLFELVRSHALPGVSRPKPIVSYVGWPLTITKSDWAEIGYAGTFVRIPRPPGFDESLHPDFAAEPAGFPPDRSPLHRYAWALGMTAMRERQTAATAARVVMGGRTGRQPTWYAGRIPGVLEEILLSLQAEQPVYLVGAFGGCARLVFDLLEGRERREMTWEYQRQAPQAEPMRALYEEKGTWWDYPEMIEFVVKRGYAGLNNGLDLDENRRLATTQTPETIVELLLTGLRRRGSPPATPAA
ncbi:MAG TPA: TIR domain-containing protein [Thermoanaerobaculia bacterium]|nr:TIR domain-containing protein [Thermoanaerobaculia bacterium]